MKIESSFENVFAMQSQVMEDGVLKLSLIAEDVATMKEKTDDGVIRVRRWVRVKVEELQKAVALANWTEVNPREQNLKSKPAKEMKLTLTGDARDIFHFLNRGISISALDCSVKNIKDKKEVTIILSDLNEHGIFDGGHSFKVLMDALEKSKILGLKHVMLEIFTGVEDILYDLARSRNTSTQVKEKSLANLEGKFDFVKDTLVNECFFNNISWVENDDGNISINYIIQILTAFNKNLAHKSMPRTYSGAGSCETSYIREFDNNKDNMINNVYYKLTPLYSDIFKFVDHVLVSLPAIYNKNGYESERGNFGKLRGITYKPDFFPLLFSPNNKRTSYKIPNALFFPILAAMRQLYKEDENGMFEWIVDPITAFDAISQKLVTKVMGYYFERNGYVNEMGKSLGLWIDTFELVNAYLNDYLKELEIEKLKQKLAFLEN
ncbi:AIPR family protein [Paraclostridium ghonii]|uniref:AIPR family protein n=1 Tax=Paraclostridium ghonii TaxID=29358 RepID=UPI00202CCBE0|nr:AIPR family protein [Paeniclostridium ghonii]MCM0167982.1 AIPR family protein [Paeniclostridium ghonii]